MTGFVLSGFRLLRLSAVAKLRPLEGALRAAGPSLLFGFRLWASVSLAFYAAFWLQLDNPFWAGASAAIVCQPQLGASLRKGWFRMLGTLVGAVVSVVLIACFPQERVLFLVALALWAAACAFVATLLRNFASYAASLAGCTAAIIAGDLLGTVGGGSTMVDRAASPPCLPGHRRDCLRRDDEGDPAAAGAWALPLRHRHICRSVWHAGGILIPYIIPFAITLADAAAPRSSQAFLFWEAGVFVPPITLIYTAVVYFAP
ncbi:putative membrane protein [Rhizobium sp. CF122]|uniref:FUSC family protein n=1 Tax=Rhizobium sp. CF122 TaxID=1144312 RepID=UPI0002718FCA|nr:FUSC family protein [Rhizobium sp. CF122]EJL50722.1 putative membrane protein [Rhizobium sp. CF122]